jgi:hypothetical protein
MSVNYLLHESSVGYALFEVVHQADSIGNRLKEVQDSMQVYHSMLLFYMPVVLNPTRISPSLEKW